MTGSYFVKIMNEIIDFNIPNSHPHRGEILEAIRAANKYSRCGRFLAAEIFCGIAVELLEEAQP